MTVKRMAENMPYVICRSILLTCRLMLNDMRLTVGAEGAACGPAVPKAAEARHTPKLRST